MAFRSAPLDQRAISLKYQLENVLSHHPGLVINLGATQKVAMVMDLDEMVGPAIPDHVFTQEERLWLGILRAIQGGQLYQLDFIIHWKYSISQNDLSQTWGLGLFGFMTQLENRIIEYMVNQAA